VKTYIVGGAVRDELLGLPVRERDHVVVGSTPEEMVRLGYKPVGKDFPVFLHPQTHEEYALARTERKSGKGYKGFTVYASPEITLEQDLERRDLTINAIAKDESTGELIDPYGGRKDLAAEVLRHVSPAFAEDPVRILRVARFAARFGFPVHEKTMNLMRGMVTSGEADHLVPERVWQEFSKGLAEEHAERMFAVLDECGFLRRCLPEIPEKSEIPIRFSGSIPVRFASLAWAMDPDPVSVLCTLRLRAPIDVHELALAVSRNRKALETLHSAAPSGLLRILKTTDAFRRPERFAELLKAARLAKPELDTGPLERAHVAAAAVDAGAIAATAASKPKIPQLIDQARLKAIQGS